MESFGSEYYTGDPKDDINKYEFSSFNKNFYQAPHQLFLRNWISKNTLNDNILLYNALGSGKCMAIDTPILMFDGTIKMVQDVIVGDDLMGDDSTPRKVLSLARGEDDMYNIIPINGNTYRVNSEHILCLKNSNKQILEISVKEYLKLSESKKKNLKGYSVKVEFQEQIVQFEPYLMGFLLGEIISNRTHYLDENDEIIKDVLQEFNLIDDNHIPIIYKCNSRENRLQLLAGFIDSNGKLNKSKNGYEFFSLNNKRISDDIIYLCKSLGFACYLKYSKEYSKKYSKEYDNSKELKSTQKLCISGNLEIIPVLVQKKKVTPRKLIKDFLTIGIKVEHVKIDKYYGFEVDGNSRYLLGDFTVTHNSCSSIGIAEGFKEYIHGIGKKIIIIAKNETIITNFKNEIKGKCTGELYTTQEEKDILSGEQKVMKEDFKETERNVEKKIKKYYEFITYGGIDKYALDYNNTVIIVDEVHNILDNKGYTALYKVLSKSFNFRLILLTATPIVDTCDEIIYISNLLNTDNLSNYIDPNQKDLYKTTYNMGGGLKKSIKFTDKGLELIEKALYGKVSFVSENIENIPKQIDMGDDLFENQIGTLKIVYCKMSKYQRDVYKIAFDKETGKDGNSSKGENSLYLNSTYASSVVYPLDKYGKNSSPPDSIFKIDELYTYSTKLFHLLQTIRSTPNELHFIFSSFTAEDTGTSLVAKMLQLNGFIEADDSNLNKDVLKYITFTGDSKHSPVYREKFRKQFNSRENRHGHKINVLIGSKVTAEGITFKNVRHVHILEPDWNITLVNQVIGRAIRNGSHDALPSAERNVKVYRYAAYYPDETFYIDIEKYKMSELKDRSNRTIYRLLKENAVDCTLNKENYIKFTKQFEDGSAQCDYQQCEYQCKIAVSGIDDVRDTYSLGIRYFDKFELEAMEIYIKELFKQSFVWLLKDIISIMRVRYGSISKESVFTILDDLTSTQKKLTDAYGRKGYIICIGTFYIFNPDGKNITDSMYTRSLDFISNPINALLPAYEESEATESSILSEQDINLTPRQIEFNEELLSRENILIGTYRKRTRNAKLNDFGVYEPENFRIIDARNKKIITGKGHTALSGKVATSYTVTDLMGMMDFLNILIPEEVRRTGKGKDVMIELIKNELARRDLIMH